MEKTEFETVKAAYIALGLKERAPMSEIRALYLEKTSQGKFQCAVIDDEHLRDEFVRYHEAYVTLGKHHAGTGASMDDDLSYYPPDQIFQLHLNQGIYYILRQNYIKASEKFQEAYKINNKDTTVLIYMGFLLMKRKNYYAAEKYLKTAIQIDRNCDDAWFFLGECYHRAGEYKKAMPMYETAKALNPGRSQIAARMKEIREKTGIKPAKGSGKKTFLHRAIEKLIGKG
jgi:tetratricopeptide (TPR) repeat protein